MWPASRSPWPRRSTSRTAAASTTGPAPSATSCRTTCCRCWPASSPTRPPGTAPSRGWRRSRTSSARLRPLDAEHTVRGQYDGYLDVAGCGPGLDHGVVRRCAARRRLLALGRRADRHPGGQVHAGHRHRGLVPVPAAARTRSSGPLPASAANRLRFRIWPESEVGLTLVGKKPGAGWTPEVEDLSFAHHGEPDMRPYDRLIGAALDGQRWLFARQETVEAAWRVVDPVLGDATPVTPLRAGQLGAQGSGPPAAGRRHLVRPRRLMDVQEAPCRAQVRPRVVIIGGGFAGLFAARALRKAAVDVTLVDRAAHHLFQPLLYQCATGILSEGQIAAPLRDLLKKHRNVECLLAEVEEHRRRGARLVAARPGRRTDRAAVRPPHRRRRRTAVVLRARRVRRVGARHEDDGRRARDPPQDRRRVRDGRDGRGRRRAAALADLRPRRRRSDRSRAGRADPRARHPHPARRVPPEPPRGREGAAVRRRRAAAGSLRPRSWPPRRRCGSRSWAWSCTWGPA